MISPASFFRAVRHYSITFAVVFAAALLGVSLPGLLRKLLGELSLHWLLLWFLPFLLIGLAARFETHWIKNPATRRRWSLGIVAGAIVLSIAIKRIQNALHPPPPPAVEQPASPPEMGRSRSGPRSK